MDKERAGPKIIKYFSKAVNLIVKMITFTTGREDISIDDFLPIMVYLFISVGPMNVISNVGTATYFLLSDEENENTGYSLANIEGCIDFIKQYNEEYGLEPANQKLQVDACGCGAGNHKCCDQQKAREPL